MPCDLGDPGGGSLVSAWYFVASLTRWYGLVVWLFLVCLLLCHTNRDDTKLSPLALITPFTHELESVTSLFGMCGWFLILFGCCLCVLFVGGPLPVHF